MNSNVTPIGNIADKLPKVLLQRQVKTLRDLYGAFGEKTACNRYGRCWNIFPSAFTIEDLDKTAEELRAHLKQGFADVVVLEKSPEFYSRFENLGKDKLLNMLRCIHSLRHDLLALAKETKDQEC